MSFLIRTVTRNDIPVLVRLARAFHRHQGAFNLLDEDAIARDGFGSEVKFQAIVAEEQGRAVGYALYCEAYESGCAAAGCFLCDLYVRPKARSRGIGRSLMAHVARIASENGRGFVWWISRAWNAEAQAFFDKLGANSGPVMAHSLVFDDLAALAAEATFPISSPAREAADGRSDIQ